MRFAYPSAASAEFRSVRNVGEMQSVKRPARPDQIVQGKVIVRLYCRYARSLRGQRSNQTGVRPARAGDDFSAIARVKQSRGQGKILPPPADSRAGSAGTGNRNSRYAIPGSGS